MFISILRAEGFGFHSKHRMKFLIIFLLLFLAGCTSAGKEEKELNKLVNDFDITDLLVKDKSTMSSPSPSSPSLESKPLVKVQMISKYDALIKEQASVYGFDWLLISAQIFTESRFKPLAISESSGAVGLMQILPSTAKWLGTDPNLLTNPNVNIKVGCYYNFKNYSLLVSAGTEEEKLALMLASYNAGPGRVQKLVNRYRTWDKIEPHLPAETRTYVLRIWEKYADYLNRV